MNLASLDHSPDAVANLGHGLVKQFGLNAAEMAVISNAGQTLKLTLSQLRQSLQATMAGKTVLAPADSASISNLVAQRDQLIATLAQQILSSVRPETAARLRVPGDIVATKVNGKGGN